MLSGMIKCWVWTDWRDNLICWMAVISREYLNNLAGFVVSAKCWLAEQMDGSEIGWLDGWIDGCFAVKRRDDWPTSLIPTLYDFNARLTCCETRLSCYDLSALSVTNLDMKGLCNEALVLSIDPLWPGCLSLTWYDLYAVLWSLLTYNCICICRLTYMSWISCLKLCPLCLNISYQPLTWYELSDQ